MIHFFNWLGRQGLNDWVAEHGMLLGWIADIAYTAVVIYLVSYFTWFFYIKK